MFETQMSHIRLSLGDWVGPPTGGWRPGEIIAYLTDKRSALRWIDGGRIVDGHSCRLQLSFRRDLIRRKIRSGGKYVWAARSIRSEFAARASGAEVNSWAA